MFDIGFWELVLIAVVGLLVLGPERLPTAIRTGSLWLNRFRRMFSDIKRDIERELGTDELKRDLHNQRIMDTLRETRDQVAGELQKTRRQLDDIQSANPSRLPDDLPYDVSDIVKPDPPEPEAESADKTRP